MTTNLLFSLEILPSLPSIENTFTFAVPSQDALEFFGDSQAEAQFEHANELITVGEDL